MGARVKIRDVKGSSSEVAFLLRGLEYVLGSFGKFVAFLSFDSLESNRKKFLEIMKPVRK